MQLTEQQKKALIDATVKYYNTRHEFPVEIDDLSECDEIAAMAPYSELFYQNANRHISDYVMDQVFQKADSRFV